MYRNAQFMLSVNRLADLPEDSGIEVAFAGRSNAGKSSALNTLCGQKALARVSKTPGRTQMINYFRLNESCRLVDLPGYGYAKVPVAVQRHWYQLIEQYLESRRCLAGIVIVMDIRHPLTEHDWRMLEWSHQRDLDIYLLLTKADKFKRGRCMQTLKQVENELQGQGIPVSLQSFSALTRDGLPALCERLNEWFLPSELPVSE